jgi:mRNA interferase YafQ
MKIVSWQNSFKKDIKRCTRRGYSIPKIQQVIAYLEYEQPLPASTRPHMLHGEWAGTMECHIAPDWLLLYEVNEHEIILVGTGTHADLFE